ncbi:hypothetical protein NSK11_contig00053-0001 [Nocardia seriolae]|uniref:Uncharacterized protein n=1 Tax=Nocardia seriolae TaxID=37332 RepID=A0ABC9YVH5_9NOCA|nr:hypothetical protein NS07_v2contig00049-0049 [Nocardia seriolae]GAP29283.1 hypothetical protein NSK11_contig00053-0001 [Nocardia seriolae]
MTPLKSPARRAEQRVKFTCRLRRGALVFRYRSSHYPMLLLARQGWFVDSGVCGRGGQCLTRAPDRL